MPVVMDAVLVVVAVGRGELADPEALQNLEGLIHPAVARERRAFLARHSEAPLVVLDIPLLFEKGGFATMPHNSPEYLHLFTECVKAAMAEMGLLDEIYRLPLVPPRAASRRPAHDAAPHARARAQARLPAQPQGGAPPGHPREASVPVSDPPAS